MHKIYIYDMSIYYVYIYIYIYISRYMRVFKWWTQMISNVIQGLRNHFLMHENI